MPAFMSNLRAYPDLYDEEEEDEYEDDGTGGLLSLRGLASPDEPAPEDAPPTAGLLAEREHGIGHPGTLESFIPVWGSAREAAADLEDGNYAGAVLNGLLALSDLTGSGFVLKAIGKAALKTLAKAQMKGLAKKDFEKLAKAVNQQLHYSRNWDAVRKRLQRDGHIRPGEEGHHWLIPQNGWGKYFPNSIKNRAWNIKSLPKATHRRLHTNFMGEVRYDPLRRYWYGMPTWSKADTLSALGHPVSAPTIDARAPDDEIWIRSK